MASELSRRHTVYALDPPGQGGTRVLDPALGYDVDTIAHALAGLLDALELPSTPLVGHSWGGGFALRLAQLHPNRIQRLALLAPGGLDVADVWEFRMLRQPVIGELATTFASAASVRHMMRKSFAHPDRIPSGTVPREAARMMRSAPDAAALRRDMLRVERHVRWTDTERDLHQVLCPTLILWGDRDRYFPVRLLDRFTHRLPDVEAHVRPCCGHSLHDDCPDQIYPLLTDFLTPAAQPPSSRE